MANVESVDKIRGITQAVATKLKENKILNTEQLLKAGSTPEARKGLAKQVGVDQKGLMDLLNRADLDRVSGIGGAYANLLEEAGVDTVKELSKRTPSSLHTKLVEINTAKKITTHPPTLQQVETWVKEAKGLPVILEY